MKSTLKRLVILGLLVTLFSGLALPAAADAFLTHEQLSGVWRLEVSSNATEEYTFDENTATKTTRYRDGDYGSYAEGTYEINGNVLTIQFDTAYADTSSGAVVNSFTSQYTVHSVTDTELELGLYGTPNAVFSTYTKFDGAPFAQDAKSFFSQTDAEDSRTDEPMPPLGSEAGFDNFQPTLSYTDQFSDVSTASWYYAYVNAGFELGLIQGSSAVSYNPNGQITLAETVALAARLHNIYHGGSGQFQQGAPWYQVYVDYAVQNGILTASQFSSYGAQATRSQFAQILAAALPEDALAPINNVYHIPDVADDAGYAPAVLRLYKAGVLTGNDAYGTFYPTRTIARSEVAAIIARMADVSLRQSFTLEGDTPPDLSVPDSPSGDGYAYLAGNTFRAIRQEYPTAVAQCAYVYDYYDANGDLCVLVSLRYKILTDWTQLTLYNLTQNTVIDDPISHYERLADRAYGASSIAYMELAQEVSGYHVKMLQAMGEALTSGVNPWDGTFVDATTLNQ